MKIWHDTTETPRDAHCVLVVTNLGTICYERWSDSLSFNDDDLQWCYIRDLVQGYNIAIESLKKLADDKYDYFQHLRIAERTLKTLGEIK